MSPLRWLRNLVARRRMEQDLAEEIELHLQEKTEFLMAEGMPHADALAAARRAFGNVALARERSLDVWRARLLHDYASDMRYAVRQLRRTPGFAAAAILTLAVGIGANSAVFSVVNALVLRPLPFANPEAVVSVQSMNLRESAAPTTLSYFTFFEFRRAGVFQSVASYRDSSLTLAGDGFPVQLAAQIVSADFFDVLGIAPTLGRGFLPAEEDPSARVVILSHELWRTRFGADPGVVGRSISVDEESHTVVGVTPPGFAFPIRPQPVQIWTTLARDASSQTVQPITEQRGARLLHALARLAPGTSIEETRARLDAVAARLAAEHPTTHKNLPATYVRPEIEHILGDARDAILLLWAAVSLVLLIACANIANMLLARTSDRNHELSVRTAIGASRGRVARQLLAENLTLALCGAALGIVMAIGIVRLVVPMVADALPRAVDIRVDAGVLAFTGLVALGVAALVSLPPVLWIEKALLGGAMRAGARGATGRQERVRGALVVAQVSIGLVLLCGASTFASGFVRLMQRDLGFSPENVLTFRVELPGARYTTEAQVAFIDRLLERLDGAPGVASAAVGLPLPLTGNTMVIAFDLEGRSTEPSARPSSNMALVSPGYFRTLGVPVLEGRGFTASDDGRHPRVLVVNKAFAEKFFPGESAVGKRIASGATSNRDPAGAKIFREIVGVVGNARQSFAGRSPEPIYYFPYKQLPWGPPAVIVRSALPASAVVPQVRRLARDLDPGVPVYGARTVHDILVTGMAPARFLTTMMGGFAAIGLLLTATGLYGLLSYAVLRRSREIGVRMVLGATRRGIVAMVLGRALALIGTGTLIGAAAGFFTQTLLLRLPLPIDAPGPVGWLPAAILVVLLTALAAAYPPARRAASIEPTTVLRSD